MVSAVAARLAAKLLGTATNTTADNNVPKTQTPPSKDSPYGSTSDQSLSNTPLNSEDEGSIPDDLEASSGGASDEEKLPRKRLGRYFPSAVENEEAEADPEFTATENDGDQMTPIRHPKRSNLSSRRHREPKQLFSDPDCISNWKPIWNGIGRNVERFSTDGEGAGWIIGLTEGETIIPKGTLNLKVIAGAIEITGANITPEAKNWTEIYAPPSHPLPVIKSKKASASSKRIENLSMDPSNFCAVIQLTDLNTGIQAIDQVWSSHGLKRSVWGRSPNVHPIRGQSWNLILSLTPEVACLRPLPTWSEALSKSSEAVAADHISYLVEGSKGAGKSTFSTLLVNHLLNKYESVALLDLDPGQPLLTPPTLISLHFLDSPILGPTFCRLSSPYQSASKSIYLGHNSPKDCSYKYLEAANQLLSSYLQENRSRSHSDLSALQRRRRRCVDLRKSSNLSQKRSDHIPLVINTMGWTKGLGEELLNQIREFVQPTHIFCLADRGSRFEDGRLINLETIGTTPLSLRLTSADSRMLNIISYLYSTPRLAPDPFIDRWDFSIPLWAKRPFEVRPEPLDLPDHPDFDRSHLGYALNGTMIGFVDRFEGWWIGFGLVRAIDPSSRTIQILTPSCPTEEDEREIGFVKCSEPELPIICSFGEGQNVPYTKSYERRRKYDYRVGAERRRVRRNVQRRSQLIR